MTTYTVSEIENHVAKIEFEDGSFSYLELNSNMTEAELDDMVSMMLPPKYKSGGSTPSFLKARSSPRPRLFWNIARNGAPTGHSRPNTFGRQRMQNSRCVSGIELTTHFELS